MKQLTTDQLIALHSQLIETSGGLAGIRNRGLIESSLANVFDVYFGIEKYPTIEEKAARLCYSLVKNHAFLDGNKRIGIFAMLVLLEVNGVVLECTDKELVHLGYRIAASELSYNDILAFIQNH